MTVFIDELKRYTGKGRLSGLWSHMATDSYDLAELHELAAKIGLKRAWFQDHPLHPHYDVRPVPRILAIEAGAVPVSQIALAKRCSRLLMPRGRIARHLMLTFKDEATVFYGPYASADDTLSYALLLTTWHNYNQARKRAALPMPLFDGPDDRPARLFLDERNEARP